MEGLCCCKGSNVWEGWVESGGKRVISCCRGDVCGVLQGLGMCCNV